MALGKPTLSPGVGTSPSSMLLLGDRIHVPFFCPSPYKEVCLCVPEVMVFQQ